MILTGKIKNDFMKEVAFKEAVELEKVVGTTKGMSKTNDLFKTLKNNRYF